MHVVIFDDRVEAAILAAIVHELRDGNAAAHESGADGGLAKHQQALAVLVGERLEKHGVDHAKDGGVGADTETEDDDGGDGEAEIFAHHAKGEGGILAEHGEMFAGSGGENSFRRFPPGSPDAQFASFARGYFAKLVEDLLPSRADATFTFHVGKCM